MFPQQFLLDSDSKEIHNRDKNLYSILGCVPESTCEQILVEYRKLARDYHPDKSSAERKAELESRFCELQYAKEILTDPERRKDYDKYRGSGLAITYEQWGRIFQKNSHNSIHWANQARNPIRPLCAATDEQEIDQESFLESWRGSSPHVSRTLDQFRKYQI